MKLKTQKDSNIYNTGACKELLLLSMAYIMFYKIWHLLSSPKVNTH